MAKPSKTTIVDIHNINSKQSAQKIKTDIENEGRKNPKAEINISIVRTNTPKSLPKSKGGK